MECKVIFADESLKNSYEELDKAEDRLAKEIKKALNDIQNNVFIGRNVRKSLIPKSLIQKYEIDNLWIYNLRKDWRLLYSVGRDEIEVIAIILDWMDHKDYERLFNF
jgi:Txe/YoeB family toxin of Txe-Axe toxin-antitoxin module